MKKYLNLKMFNSKVVAAALAASMLVSNVGAMKSAGDTDREESTSSVRATDGQTPTQEAKALLAEAQTSPKKAAVAFIVAKTALNNLKFLQNAFTNGSTAYSGEFSDRLDKNDHDLDIAEAADKEYFDRLEAFHNNHAAEFAKVFFPNMEMLSCCILVEGSKNPSFLEENQKLLICAFED